MKTLVKTLNLKGNPFEHYTAETEPNIANYAVRPPYLQSISDRAIGLSSFILFGDRGAGKSATRITVFNEVWKHLSRQQRGERTAFAVNLTDYSRVQELLKKDRLTERDIIAVVAFYVVEQLLVWLSSLEDDERTIFIDGLDKQERTLVFALIKGFYLSVPEMDREISTSDALKLLNSAWTTKSALWASQRWDSLSKILAGVVSALSKKELDDDMDIAAPAEALLKSLTGSAPNAPRAILTKLVEFVRAFGFSGVCVLVDKVDETPATSNSAESTARLVYPLLAHVQLMEIDGFSWILFLWSNVKDHLTGKLSVRLDKLAHANITWNDDGLRELLDARVQFYSDHRLQFSSLLSPRLKVEDVVSSVIKTAVSSPRELIKLMDTIFREHDARGDEAPDLLDEESIIRGQDVYAVDTIGGWYGDKPLQQVLRLGKTTFVNRDVQSAFRIGDQGARVKIKNWEDAGLVRQSGTAPSELGGKPANRYVVADARIARIITGKLVEVVGAEIEPEE